MFRSIIVRTVLPLLLAAGTVAYFGLPYIDRLLAQWFRSDVELRAQLLMSSMQEALPVYLAKNDQAGLRRYVARITADQRLLGLLICRPDGTPLIKSERMPAAVDCEQAQSVPDGRSGVLETPTGSAQVSVFDQNPPGMAPYRVAIVHDLSFVDRRQNTARDYLIAFAGISVLILALFLALAGWFLLRRWANVLLRDISGRRFTRQCPVRSRCRCRSCEGARGAARDGREPAHRDGLSRELDSPGAAAGGAGAAALAADCGGLQSGTLFARIRGARRHRGAGARQRHGDGAGAGHARLLGHLGGARQRQRRPRGGRRSRPRTRAAREPGLHAAARMAVGGRRAGVSTTGWPTRVCGRSAIWPTCGRHSAARIGWPTSSSIASSPRSWRARSRARRPLILIQDYHFALLPRHGSRAPARSDDRAVLAHPLAQRGDLRCLPVEARNAVEPADGRHPRLSHAVSLPATSSPRSTASSSARSITST